MPFKRARSWLPAAGLLVAVSAEALAQERPDLTDYDQLFNAPLPGPGTGHHRAFFTAKGAGLQGRAGIEVVMHSQKAAGSWWNLNFTIFEPDKITRKADLAKFQQGRFVRVLVTGRTTGGGFGASATVPGCKAKAQARGGQALWQLSCPSDTLAVLGLTVAEQARFARLTGSTKVKLKGKTP